MQNLFTRFFERGNSNDNSVQSQTRAKKQSSRLVTPTTLNLFSLTRNQPFSGRSGSESRNGTKPLSGAIPGKGALDTSKGTEKSPRIIKARQATHTGLNAIKIRQSQSPKTGKSQLQKFLRPQEKSNLLVLTGNKEMGQRNMIETPKKKIINIVSMEKANLNRIKSKEGSLERLRTERDDPSPRRRTEFDRYLEERKHMNKIFLNHAKKGQAEDCLKLLSKEQGVISADINTKDVEGWTGLHYAASAGNVKFVNLLLYNDARVDIQDSSGVTPLMIAVAKLHTQVSQVTNFLIRYS